MTIWTETTLSKIEAELRAAFATTAFKLRTFHVPGVGRCIGVTWRLGPSQKAVAAVTGRMVEDISIFLSRIKPCAVCGRDADGERCFEHDPDLRAIQ